MTNLLPLFKWTGGKRKELPHIQKHYPKFVTTNPNYTFVEPFVGAGAVYWSLNNLTGHNIINDFDKDVSNFYQHVKTQNETFLNHIRATSALYNTENKNSEENHKLQEANYYKWRDLDRDENYTTLPDADKAARFWIVNQLAFSGMRRHNNKGQFNVPYGHYKNLNHGRLTSTEHVQLLQNTTILNGDYKTVVEQNDKPDTFIFVDPPYTRVMKTYSAGNVFDDAKQHELADTLKNLKHASFMVVIDKSDLTSKLYKNYITETYNLNYGVNIKNRFSTEVQHILATNY